MNIISLSDSDDDVPLIPTATTSLKRRLPCDKFPAKKTSFFEDSGSSMVLLDPSDEVIDLSSDDDGPSTKDAIHKLPLSTQQKEEVGLLKHTAESCTAPGVSKLAANENLDARSDQTEVYSLSSDTDKPSSEKTEVYSNSDLDSLPEIDLGEPGTAYNPGMRKEIRPDVIIRSSVLPVKDNGENFQPITTNLPDGSLEDIYTNIKPRQSDKSGHAHNQGKKDTQSKKQEEKQQKALGKQQKALEKQRDIAMRNALKKARRAAQPGEAHRHMLLEVDGKLEKTPLGICLEASAVANSVTISFIPAPMRNTIVFKRRLVPVTQGGQEYVQESDMAVVIPMDDLVNLITASMQSDCGVQPCLTLKSYIKKIQQSYNAKPTLCILGCEKYFRTVKTQRNRLHKNLALGTCNNSTKNKHMTVINQIQCEESLAELQLLYDVTFINCGAEQDVAHTILRMNKAIAEAPVKRQKYTQEAQAVRTSGLKIGKDGYGTRMVWQRMLQEFRNITADVAAAIVIEWPSPLMLYQKYQSSQPVEGQLLLQDIEVRRGGGVVSTKRRVGKETSRRVYEMLTESQHDFIIN